MNIRPEAAARLITWISSPTNVEELTEICSNMSIEELQMCMLSEDNTLSRVAWLFYGERRNHTSSVKLQMTRLAGNNQILTIVADGVPVSGTLHLQGESDEH